MLKGWIRLVDCFTWALFFQTILRFTAKSSKRYRNFLYTLSLTTSTSSLLIKISCQNGTFVILDEPLLTKHYHPEFIIYIMIYIIIISEFILYFTLGVIYSLSLSKYIMECICHYNIIQCGFTALKVLCSFYSSLKPLATTDILHFPTFAFFTMSYNWNYTIGGLFMFASFT